ncbi:MAG: hypothetical protein ACKVJA_01210, partial [Flavobacteriales bacterium]
MNNTLFKVWISLFIIFSVSTNSFSQRTCGSTEKMNSYFNEFPEQKIIRQKLEKKILSTNSEFEKQSVIIPVVFHVVYNTAEQNISDIQILSQLDVINEDFNRTNT